MSKHSVTIPGLNRTFKVAHGSLLIRLLEEEGFDVASPCGGNGTCGGCRVKVISGDIEMTPTQHLTADEIMDGWVLACQAKVISDIEIELSEAGKAVEVLDTGYSDIEVDDLTPLKTIKGVRNISAAVDLGTTTIAVSLLDTGSGQVLSSASDYNGQSIRGYDIINRIVHCEIEGGLEELRGLSVQTINNLIEKAAENGRINTEDITSVTVSGNTTMIYLFLGKDPADIRSVPAKPIQLAFVPISGSKSGLGVNPDAVVSAIPCVANYLGGDIVGGVLATGLHENGGLSLFLDIGTNGETVIGNKDWMMGCACSAGPAFEGMGVVSGMRATRGAIETITVGGDLRPSYDVIGGGHVRPMGICGTAMIDLLSELYNQKGIDQSAKFVSPSTEKGFIRTHGGWLYTIVDERQSGSGRAITISEGDLDTLVRTKAAIYAGIETMLKHLSLDVSQIEKVYVAGGFGQALDIEKSINIGMLPNLPLDKFKFVGNTSLAGASLACLSREAREEITSIARRITYLDLSGSNDFVESFSAASFIPHTDKNLFITP